MWRNGTRLWDCKISVQWNWLPSPCKQTLIPLLHGQFRSKTRCCLSPTLSNILQNDLHDLFKDSACRREPLDEAHDSTFGILEYYHCWRFHGSGVIAAPQIIGLIFFCTGMHHEYFLMSSMCFRITHLCSKIPKIYNWSMDNGVHSVRFRGDFAIKTVAGFLR